MSKTKIAVVTALLTWCVSASAVTFGQLAEKNARLIELQADLAIAKAEADLSEQRAKGAAAAIGAKGPNVPAIQLDGALAAKVGGSHSAKAQEPAPELKSEVYLNAIHGAASNLSADFESKGQAISRKKGDPIFDGWTISSIDYPRVMIVKRASGKASRGACKSVTLGSSIASSPNC